jgi:hypothetical protein
MAVARAEQVICRCERHSVDQDDDAMRSRDLSRHRLGAAGFDPSQRERPACGWSLLCEGLGRCSRRASSGFHPKRQTPFRVKQEREDGVALSAPEKPPDACTPAARREGRVAAQCCATTLAETKAMNTDVYERISSQIANEFEGGARSRLKPRSAKCAAGRRITQSLRGISRADVKGVSHVAA